MSINKTKKAIKELGMSVRHRDGEWRINFLNGSEATAYYTTDAADALATAKVMAAQIHNSAAVIAADPLPKPLPRPWWKFWS